LSVGQDVKTCYVKIWFGKEKVEKFYSVDELFLAYGAEKGAPLLLHNALDRPGAVGTGLPGFAVN